MNKQETLRDRVFSYLEKNKNEQKSEVVAHFVKEGKASSTIYNIINRFEQGLNITRKN